MVIPQERFFSALVVFQLSIVSFILVIIKVPYNAIVMAYERMDFFSIISILDAILNLFVVIVISNLSYDNLILYGFFVMLCNLFNYIVFYAYCKKKIYNFKFERNIDKTLLQSMFSFSGWNLFGSFSYMIKDQGVNLLLNLFFGPVVNAARGVASQVNSGFHSFVLNLIVPVRPQVIQSYARGDFQRVLRLTYSVSKLSILFQYLMALPILFEINYVLKLWLGENIPEHTSAFIIIIVITSFINNLNNPISTIVHASGVMKNYQVWSSLAVMSCIPVSYFALKMGATSETCLLIVFGSMLFAQVIALIVLKQIIEYNVLDYIKNVLRPFIGVVITTIWIPYLIHLFIPEGFSRTCVVFCLSIVIVSSITYTVALNKTEQELIFKVFNLKKIFKKS